MKRVDFVVVGVGAAFYLVKDDTAEFMVRADNQDDAGYHAGSVLADALNAWRGENGMPDVCVKIPWHLETDQVAMAQNLAAGLGGLEEEKGYQRDDCGRPMLPVGDDYYMQYFAEGIYIASR